MTEFARGGIVKRNDVQAILGRGCDYIIPSSQAKRLRAALDRLNEGGVEYVEVVDPPDSFEEGI